ncbi:MAG: transposase family protein [Planctomycetaceae bacterium]
MTDPRVDRGHNHDLLEMVFMALTATICGADGWVDVERFAKSKWEWFRQYIELPHGVPRMTRSVVCLRGSTRASSSPPCISGLISSLDRYGTGGR